MQTSPLRMKKLAGYDGEFGKMLFLSEDLPEIQLHVIDEYLDYDTPLSCVVIEPVIQKVIDTKYNHDRMYSGKNHKNTLRTHRTGK